MKIYEMWKRWRSTFGHQNMSCRATESSLNRMLPKENFLLPENLSDMKMILYGLYRIRCISKVNIYMFHENLSTQNKTAFRRAYNVCFQMCSFAKSQISSFLNVSKIPDLFLFNCVLKLRLNTLRMSYTFTLLKSKFF